MPRFRAWCDLRLLTSLSLLSPSVMGLGGGASYGCSQAHDSIHILPQVKESCGHNTAASLSPFPHDNDGDAKCMGSGEIR